MMDVEQAIREVAAVYRALTGRPIEPAGADLPETGDPAAHVEQQYRMLRSILDAPAAGCAQGAAVFSPPVDVTERDGEIRCDIDLPSVRRDEVTVAVEGGYLIVRGHRKAPDDAAIVRHAERRFGAFQKVIALPPGARRDGIEAALRDGVLSVTVPRSSAPEVAAAEAIEIR